MNAGREIKKRAREIPGPLVVLIIRLTGAVHCGYHPPGVVAQGAADGGRGGLRWSNAPPLDPVHSFRVPQPNPFGDGPQRAAVILSSPAVEESEATFQLPRDNMRVMARAPPAIPHDGRYSPSGAIESDRPAGRGDVSPRAKSIRPHFGL